MCSEVHEGDPFDHVGRADLLPEGGHVFKCVVRHPVRVDAVAQRERLAVARGPEARLELMPERVVDLDVEVVGLANPADSEWPAPTDDVVPDLKLEGPHGLEQLVRIHAVEVLPSPQGSRADNAVATRCSSQPPRPARWTSSTR